MALTVEERARICAAGRRYIRTPWRGQGRSIKGIDCIGVGVMAYREAGFDIDEGPVDYRGLDYKRFLKVLFRYFDKLPKGATPLPADLCIYGLPNEGHLALLVDRPGGGLNGIHSPMNQRVVEARFDLARGLIRGIYTWRS